MTENDRDAALWDLIKDARWFGGKGRPAALRGVTELAVLAGDPAVSIMVAELGYTDVGDVEFYQVPVISVDGSVADATGDPAALNVIMRHLLEAGGRPAARDDQVRVHLVDPAGPSADLPGRRFGGEQSNTSIMYGDGPAGSAMLKVFRRLEPGRNLDIEVHDVIGRSGGEAARDAAHLFGWVEATWTTTTGEPATADLAMLVEQLTDVRDGYAAAFEACRTGRSFTAEALALGRALRNVHDVLRIGLPTRTVDGAAVAATMRERLDRAVAIAPALAPYAASLSTVFDAVAGGGPIQAQRIHGDFHSARRCSLAPRCPPSRPGRSSTSRVSR